MVDGIVITQYRMSDSTHKKLKYISEKEKRSMNAQIDYFVCKGIEEYEEKNGVIHLPGEEK